MTNPYTHADHAKRCREAAQAGQTLSGPFVQVRVARTPVCAQIVTAWDTPNGLEMWQLDLLGPIKGRMSMPTRLVRKCSGIDGRCSCSPAEGLDGLSQQRESLSRMVVGRMLALLADAHDMKFCVGVRELYDATIDFGARLNKHSLVRSVQLKDAPGGGGLVGFAYIYGLESPEVRQSILACAEAGLAAFISACFATGSISILKIKSKAPSLNSSMRQQLAEDLDLRFESPRGRSETRKM